MKITVLDRASMGDDTSFLPIETLGEVEIYDTTSQEMLISRIEDTDVIITNKVKIGEEAISASKKLKLICVFATGYDNIDIKAAKANGVGVCNVPGYSTESVVLYTVSTVLALATKIREYNDYVRSGDYTRSGVANLLTPVYHELAGKTWGIVGCGNIGRAVARVAEALGARVIVNKRTEDLKFTCVDINTLCKESDVISLHCPLNDSTRGLIDAEKIALMKKDVILVNEARGAVVNEGDVAKAITEGRIGAFGCDVYSVEPFGTEHPYTSIMNLPNVLLTPHAAWGAYEARERCVNIITSNISSYFDGVILNRVDI